MDKKILIINGPNLNLLGKREPDIYGTKDFNKYFEELKNIFSNDTLQYFQSNHEGLIIDQLHQSDGKFDAIIINPGAYTHTSIAIGDAIASINIPTIEVHISNVYERETFRHHSFISKPSIYTIVGEGLEGYIIAIKYILSTPPITTIRARIHGNVQGVWFRKSSYNKALELKILGLILNKSDKSVYVEASGSLPNINTFIKYLNRGPEHAQVDEIFVETIPNKDFETFEIIR